MDNKLLIIEINRDFEITIENCVRRVLDENLKSKINTPGPSEDKQSDICNIEIACQITGLVKATIYSKVSNQHIPYISRGRPLLFSKSQLMNWLQAGRPKTNKFEKLTK